MRALIQDLRFALRQVRRSPGFALTAVLILALGIAANVIVFGVLQAMILEPLDVPRPDRVVTFAPHAAGYPIFSYPEVRDVRDESTVFSAVAAEALQVLGLEADGATEPVWGSEVSGQYFEAVGIKPYLGRLLQRSDDDHPGASEAAVISWPAWKTRFGADPKIVGKVVRIDKHPYTIVGVAAESFYGTQKFLQSDLFVPMANQASLEGTNWLEDRSNKMVFPIARLKDGVTLAQAQGELDRIAARIAKRNPKEEDKLQFKLAPPGLIGDFVRGAARRFLAGVMVLAGIVLLAACANLGGLFAARTADRTREIAQQTTDFRPSNEAFESFFYDVSPGYFAAAGTPLLAGRDLLATDTANTPLVAIVNRQFARSLFHADNAVGRSFKNHSGASIQIVGMVADGKYFLTSEDPQEAVYFPILQQPSTITSVIVRTRPAASPNASKPAAAAMALAVRKIVRDLDPSIPIRSSGTWTSQLAFSFFPAQVATVSLGLFGAFGLLLSVTGTFGLASYTVSKRMRELSIRVALGAQARQILAAALGRILMLVGAGSAIGMGLGLATSHLLAHIVYQASAQDPWVVAAVVTTLLVTGSLSVAGPVRRALQADPAELLREQ